MLKMGVKKKLLINKIKSEKKIKIKKIDKIKQLEIELFKTKYVINPNFLDSSLRELNRTQVIDKNLHEIEKGILRVYTGEFGMAGSIIIGDQTLQTQIRFRNLTDYEHYINSIDSGCNPEDVLFIGYFYKNKNSSI